MYDSGFPQVGLLSRLQGLRDYPGVTIHSHLLCVFPIDNVTDVTLVTVNLEPYLSWGRSYSTTEIKGYKLLQSLENSNRLFSSCFIYKIKWLAHSQIQIPYHFSETPVCKEWSHLSLLWLLSLSKTSVKCRGRAYGPQLWVFMFQIKINSISQYWLKSQNLTFHLVMMFEQTQM